MTIIATYGRLLEESVSSPATLRALILGLLALLASSILALVGRELAERWAKRDRFNPIPGTFFSVCSSHKGFSGGLA